MKSTNREQALTVEVMVLFFISLFLFMLFIPLGKADTRGDRMSPGNKENFHRSFLTANYDRK